MQKFKKFPIQSSSINHLVGCFWIQLWQSISFTIFQLLLKFLQQKKLYGIRPLFISILGRALMSCNLFINKSSAQSLMHTFGHYSKLSILSVKLLSLECTPSTKSSFWQQQQQWQRQPQSMQCILFKALCY